MVYDPIETKLLTIAKEAGAAIIPGLEMFVHQAARQFEIWTGKPAPWDDMLKVSIVALQDRAAKAAAAAAEEKPKVKAKASASKAKKR
jgi:3-dehydroquinate dehydratase/shikimate dehydrogenase